MEKAAKVMPPGLEVDENGNLVGQPPQPLPRPIPPGLSDRTFMSNPQRNCVGENALFSSRVEAVQKEAAALCIGCCVLAECRSYAIRHEVEGVWGGYTPKQLTVVRRRVRGSKSG